MSDQPVLPTASTPSPIFLTGAAGRIALRVDVPQGPARGLAVVAHPQPLLGGSPRHPIPHRWARGACQAGWLVVRPGFRGVDGTDGSYDHGVGETDDVLTVLRWLRTHEPALPLALLGFSFGAYVTAHVASTLDAQGTPADAVVLAGMPVGEVDSGRAYATPAVAGAPLLLHGEVDTQAPLAAVLTWARAQGHPVTVMPGADHLFTGHHPWLLAQVLAGLARA